MSWIYSDIICPLSPKLYDDIIFEMVERRMLTIELYMYTICKNKCSATQNI
jgi:hypothetical protein